MNELHESALTLAKNCMAIKAGETVLILTDAECLSIGHALFDVCKDLCKEVFITEMVSREINGQEPPQQIAELMKMVDVVIAPLSKSITHTDAKRNACAANARVGTMPGITEDVMKRTMKADYHRIATLTYKVTDLLTNGKSVHLTTDLGTDITIPIEGIKAIPSTGLITEPGQYGNLPSGEAFMMPEEGKSEGVFYVDASLAGIGLIEDDPVKITIEKGLAVKFEGGRQATEFENMVNKVGEGARNLAELGIGTNYLAEINGTVLEDEKVLGTIHLALGNNVSMGGTVNVGFHVDGIITKPTLKIDDTLLLDKGKMLIE
jgi:leucyl aminopeptidase (aminopeptidase T)